MPLKSELRELESVCDNVLAHYAVLKNSKTNRARVPVGIQVFISKETGKKQCDIPAEPLDFVLDVELKSERVLRGNHLSLWYVLTGNPDSYGTLPKDMKRILGTTFKKFNLDLDGDYKKVFHRIKQDSDRRRFSTEEETIDAAEAGRDSSYADGGDGPGYGRIFPAGGFGDSEGWGDSTSATEAES